MNKWIQKPNPVIFFLLMVSLLAIACSRQKQEEKWELAWAEEFDYNGKPDAGYWGYEKGYIRNNELQYYTDQLDNVTVSDGVCTITARLEGQDSITSASINTLGKYDILYGRVEVRAKIPSALGTWPAIWMLGINMSEVGWPECGEIDIMEHVGYDPVKVHANIHTAAYNHVKGTNKGNTISVPDPSDDFHVYALEWNKDQMDFFFDDSLYFSYANDMAGDPETWPFDEPHYLLINLAYGGGWGGREGVDTTMLPLEYLIDYVRHYKKPDRPS
jgi:beta-glucanase (GH16 family)